MKKDRFEKAKIILKVDQQFASTSERVSTKESVTIPNYEQSFPSVIPPKIPKVIYQEMKQQPSNPQKLEKNTKITTTTVKPKITIPRLKTTRKVDKPVENVEKITSTKQQRQWDEAFDDMKKQDEKRSIQVYSLLEKKLRQMQKQQKKTMNYKKPLLDNIPSTKKSFLGGVAIDRRPKVVLSQVLTLSNVLSQLDDMISQENSILNSYQKSHSAKKTLIKTSIDNRKAISRNENLPRIPTPADPLPKSPQISSIETTTAAADDIIKQDLNDNREEREYGESNEWQEYLHLLDNPEFLGVLDEIATQLIQAEFKPTETPLQ